MTELYNPEDTPAQHLDILYALSDADKPSFLQKMSESRELSDEDMAAIERSIHLSQVMSNTPKIIAHHV